jgi:hypothetical protein
MASTTPEDGKGTRTKLPCLTRVFLGVGKVLEARAGKYVTLLAASAFT